MAFGKDLREMRLTRGYKLRQFAKLCGISPTYLSKIEREEFVPPSIEVITKMANLLNIDADVTCLRAGKVPTWIKELFMSEDAIYCVGALIKVKDGSYAHELFQSIGRIN